MGMSATVTVLAKDAKLPSAGQGPGFGSDILAAFALGLGLLFAGVAVRRLVLTST